MSIREVKNLNERKLQQVLMYAARPSRPEGTPKLKGLYYFGPKDSARIVSSGLETGPDLSNTGVTSSIGAQLGAQWNHRSQQALISSLTFEGASWYRASGKLISKPLGSDWAGPMQACRGIIAFDAVQCRGPRHDPERLKTHPELVIGQPYISPQVSEQSNIPQRINAAYSNQCKIPLAGRLRDFQTF